MPRSDPRIVEVLFFVGLAFAISWIIWIPAILWRASVPALPIMLLGGFGPFSAAIVVTLRRRGKNGLENWLRQIFRLRIAVTWHLVGALLLPLAFALLHHGLYRMLGGTTDFSKANPWYWFPAMVIPTALLSGGNEEPGWRGFLLPRLLQLCHPVAASTIVGLIWVVWHLPLYLSSWGGRDQPIEWFLLYCIGLSVVMTWLYSRSSGSVIPVMLLHAGTNVIFQYFPMSTAIFRSTGYDFNVLKTIVYWAAALVLVIATKGRLGTDPAAGAGAGGSR